MEEFALHVAVLAGIQMDDHQILRVLDNTEWNYSRRRWAEAFPDINMPSPEAGEEDIAWHHAVAGQAELVPSTPADAFGELWHLDRLLAIQPGDGLAYAQRANIHLQFGRIDRAEADLRSAQELVFPKDFLTWLAHREGDCLYANRWQHALWYLNQQCRSRWRQLDSLSRPRRGTRPCWQLVGSTSRFGQGHRIVH